MKTIISGLVILLVAYVVFQIAYLLFIVAAFVLIACFLGDNKGLAVVCVTGAAVL